MEYVVGVMRRIRIDRQDLFFGNDNKSCASRIKNDIALVLTLILIIVSVYLVAYEGIHFIHECSGESCPICRELHEAKALIHGAMLLSAVVFPTCFISNIRARQIFFAEKLIFPTLVSENIRLDD